ncbi:hypothetical protein D0T50_12925 [Bacteroides sp. 214]|uniref:hypothetical protein n=1 Tax=Bacteroides sp. 214 TaxID=2302935 RepID=UPI0013D81A43|nr:hypothetical protein [Bacteroides sp. 214]NDW13784.1 hypothetical protein [Bacteroides sp. 214]
MKTINMFANSAEVMGLSRKAQMSLMGGEVKKEEAPKKKEVKKLKKGEYPLEFPELDIPL